MYPDRKFLNFMRAALDLVSIGIAYWISGKLCWPHKNLLALRHGILILIMLEAIWLLSAQATRLYQDFRSRDIVYEIIAMLKNSISLFLGTIVVLFFIKEEVLSRNFVIVFGLVSLSLVFLEKYLARKFLKSIRRKRRNLRNVIIIGAGRAGLQFADTVSQNPSFGYNVLGFLDDDRRDFLNGRYLGKISELETVLVNRRVEDIVVALPNRAHKKIEDIVALCKNTTARVRIIPDLKGLGLGSYEMTTFGNLPIISFRKNSVNETHWRVIKRSFDLVFSIVIVVVAFSWLWSVIIVLQKLFNKGPIFYRAKRWGRNGLEFTCFKFRSMVPQSENVDRHGKHQATKKGDGRITSFGAFLRSTNLDELPQFINVIRGDMSVVGPRPHDSAENLKLKQAVDSYMWRHVVKPGITGWAQVNGLRGGTDDIELMKKRTIYDMWYIDNWSFWLDIQIILKTIWLSIRGDPQAY